LEALDASLIQWPVFITGMPRSGSTFLHELLLEDPENRAPRVWEVMFPVSNQNGLKSEVDARVRKAEACLWWFPPARAGSGRSLSDPCMAPHECLSIVTSCCVLGHVGGGLEYRFTPHIGIFGESGYDIVNGSSNNFLQTNFGLRYAF